MRALLTIAALGLLTSCGAGPDCSAACKRLYLDEDGCQIERPGRTLEDTFSYCYDACMEAWAVPGELGDYDPYSAAPPSEAVALENQEQAQRWTECVQETSCERLSDGYCAPVY